LTFSEEIFNQGLIEIEDKDKVICLSEKYLHEFDLASPIRDNQRFSMEAGLLTRLSNYY